MISHSNLKREHAFIPQRLDRQAPIHELLDTRWSPRSFSEEPIEAWKILSLFEAARWSPSSANEQPWSFIVATKEDADAHAALVATMNEGNLRWASNAPMLILGVAESSYSRNGRPNRHAWYDLGQSIAHLTVQASALDLAVHQMGGFDGEKARQRFAIPQGYEPVVVLAVGYIEGPDRLPADLHQREIAPRTRKRLEEILFSGQWGKPSPLVTTLNPLLNNLPSTN